MCLFDQIQYLIGRICLAFVVEIHMGVATYPSLTFPYRPPAFACQISNSASGIGLRFLFISWQWAVNFPQ